MGSPGEERPSNVGIVASECYFPSSYVSQERLEEFDGIAAGKYQIGLGQDKMAFTGAGEDINSMMMSALDNLMTKYGLDYSDIGRLEIGTETILDKSKSSKTSLMNMFGASGNSDVLGVTNKNACYGGTAALFNTVDWMESSSWDGRYGVVLAGDIAVYEPGPARPTGGAGVVALLVGPDAPLVLENRTRASHFEDAYDFYKPFLSSEYPAVDGHLSNSCYLRAVDKCYQLFADKFEKVHGERFGVFGDSVTPSASAQHFLFHQPYAKLVQKSYGRLLYNDMVRGGFAGADLQAIANEFGGIDEVASYTDRALDKACVTASKDMYNDKVYPYTKAGRNLGNSYTGSLYFGLLSLIAQSDQTDMNGDRVLMFSYGSGLAATMFSLKVQGDLTSQRETCNLEQRLEAREEATPEEFTAALKEREAFYTANNFSIAETPEKIAPGAFHLAGVDSMGRRTYAKAPLEAADAGGMTQKVAASRGFHTARRAGHMSASTMPKFFNVARKVVLRR